MLSSLTSSPGRACGIGVEFVDIDDVETVRPEIRSDKEAMRVLSVEMMSNLTLAAEVAREEKVVAILGGGHLWGVEGEEAEVEGSGDKD